MQNIQEKCEKIVYLKGLTKLCRRFIKNYENVFGTFEKPGKEETHGNDQGYIETLQRVSGSRQ